MTFVRKIGNYWIMLCVVPALVACIGADILDDPIVPRAVVISPGDTSIMQNSSLQLSAVYFNQYGLEEMVNVEFFNLNEDIVTLDQEGNVTTLMTGQAQVYAFFEEVRSDTIRINVIGSDNDVASVVITEDTHQLSLGSTVTLMASVYNINNEELPGRAISWESDAPSIASVTNDGVVTGISDGITEIYAISEGVRSKPYVVAVGDIVRTATFVGNSGYDGEGTAMLLLQDGSLILELGDDFKTDFALGTFVYLSNSEEGGATRSNGLELGEIFNNGAHSFDVTSIAAAEDMTVDIGEYRYVIILCKPASITFAIADFEG